MGAVEVGTRLAEGEPSDAGRAVRPGTFPWLALSTSDAPRLAFAHQTTLFIERAEHDILIHLRCCHAHVSMTLLSRSPDVCHWRHSRPFQVRAGLKDDSLVVLKPGSWARSVLGPSERASTLPGRRHDTIEA